MISIEAIVRPERVNHVAQALEEAGCTGFYYVNVTGQGQQRGVEVFVGRGGQLARRSAVPKTLIRAVVKDDMKDAVIKAMAGQTFKAPSGITSKMDEKNHHLHKSVFIGEIKADGQFNVVWKTPGPVKAKPWSPFIEGNDKKPDEPVKK